MRVLIFIVLIAPVAYVAVTRRTLWHHYAAIAASLFLILAGLAAFSYAPLQQWMLGLFNPFQTHASGAVHDTYYVVTDVTPLLLLLLFASVLAAICRAALKQGFVPERLDHALFWVAYACLLALPILLILILSTFASADLVDADDLSPLQFVGLALIVAYLVLASIAAVRFLRHIMRPGTN